MHCNKLILGVYLLASVLSLEGCKSEYELAPRPSPKTENTKKNPARQVIDGRKTYVRKHGKPEANFNKKDGQGLQVTITTNRLRIASVTGDEVDSYQEYLYGDSQVMEKFATGETKAREYTQGRIQGWVDRWRQENPFSGLTVWLKKEYSPTEKEEFLGHVILGGGDEFNSSEIAFMIRKDRWNQGYGYEAIGAAVLFYAPAMAEKNYKLSNGQEFKRIIATSRTDNENSVKILQKIGFKFYKTSNKFNHLRKHYELAVDDLE